MNLENVDTHLASYIVYVCDIEQDIDDKIAVEYLHNSGLLKCVVLDRPTNSPRVDELKEMGVVFEEDIPEDTDTIFCGGALTRIAEYLRKTETPVQFFACNGGYAGSNIVAEDDQLPKFKGKTHVRTYNFNCDVESAKEVLESDMIKKIRLVSKNVCHDHRNTRGRLHNDEFLNSYKLKPNKCLHDLLMVKEALDYIYGSGEESLCTYLSVDCDHMYTAPYKNKAQKFDMWGSIPNNRSHIEISIGIIDERDA